MKRIDIFYLWIANRLPLRLIYWCTNRGVSFTCTEKYPNTPVTEVLAMGVLGHLLDTVDPEENRLLPLTNSAENAVGSAESERETCWNCGKPTVIAMRDCPNCGSAYDRSDNRLYPSELPDPTAVMLASPEFNAIWDCIRDWDVQTPYGRTGVTGNHARAILDALNQVQARESRRD